MSPHLPAALRKVLSSCTCVQRAIRVSPSGRHAPFLSGNPQASKWDAPETHSGHPKSCYLSVPCARPELGLGGQRVASLWEPGVRASRGRAADPRPGARQGEDWCAASPCLSASEPAPGRRSRRQPPPRLFHFPFLSVNRKGLPAGPGHGSPRAGKFRPPTHPRAPGRRVEMEAGPGGAAVRIHPAPGLCCQFVARARPPGRSLWFQILSRTCPEDELS